MQMFNNLPWYGYVILAVAVISYVYKYFKKAKEGYEEPELKKTKFKTSESSSLTKEQLFAIALYTPLAEWWGAETNTMNFVNSKTANNYLKRWRIDTAEGYWSLTEYFMKDGRRWYYDFIHNTMKTQPEENWEKSMIDHFGNNERAFKYLAELRSDLALNELKQNDLLTFDNEMDLGIAGYDTALLVGQARKAFTANIIIEEEAWKVINFASGLARQHFSSWEEFGKSFILGFAFDQQHRERSYRKEVYHLYKQTIDNPNSPWNTIDWPTQ